MFFYVYQLRERGHRLTKRAILAHAPAYGRLVLRPAEHEQFGPKAQICDLFDSSANTLLHPLIGAHVAKITAGIHITGLEYHGRGTKSKITKAKQSWICAPTEAEVRSLVAMIPDLKGSSGFSPEDDDIEH